MARLKAIINLWGNYTFLKGKEPFWKTFKPQKGLDLKCNAFFGPENGKLKITPR
jgi:hypothetical protein